MGIAKHFETGETLPDALFDKVLKARTYRAASMMMRQVHFATVDLTLHSTFDPAGDSTIYDLERDVAKTTCVLMPLKEDRFMCACASTLPSTRVPVNPHVNSLPLFTH